MNILKRKAPALATSLCPSRKRPKREKRSSVGNTGDSDSSLGDEDEPAITNEMPVDPLIMASETFVETVDDMMQILHGILSENDEDSGDDGSDESSEGGGDEDADDVAGGERAKKKKKREKRKTKHEKQTGDEEKVSSTLLETRELVH